MQKFEAWPIVKALLPRVPLIGKTALTHALGVSDNCKHWDLNTELTVNVLRSFVRPPSRQPLSKLQQTTMTDPGIRSYMWISKVTMVKPAEDGIREALFNAIEAMKDPGMTTPGGYKEPELLPVEGEWTGYRAGTTKNSPGPEISEAEKYAEMMKEVSSPTTVLYFHGGAFYLLDPCTHRLTTTKLARLTKGRCFSVRYRLAPQNPFPAALLDALVAYFSLLYPAPDAVHAPVAPEHIVFAGDSAGGNLSTVLLQTLMQLRRMNVTVPWNGVEREVPLPAGVALNSSWMDITHSLPSCNENANFDYLPPLSANPRGPQYPEDSIWPANPPRRHFYCEDQMLLHPLVSPTAAKVKDWEGSCPMWMVIGQELLADENKYVAMVVARAGVKVVFEEFETMPHCFALVLNGNKAGRKTYELWASFISAVVEKPESVVSRSRRYKPKSLDAVQQDLEMLSPFTEEEVMRRMKAQAGELDQKQPDALTQTM